MSVCRSYNRSLYGDFQVISAITGEKNLMDKNTFSINHTVPWQRHYFFRLATNCNYIYSISIHLPPPPFTPPTPPPPSPPKKLMSLLHITYYPNPSRLIVMENLFNRSKLVKYFLPHPILLREGVQHAATTACSHIRFTE